MNFFDKFVLFIAETYDIRPSEARTICSRAMDTIKEEIEKLKDTESNRVKRDVMNDPCLECKMSYAEKAACCGCPERLEYDRHKTDSYKGNLNDIR